HGAGDPDRGRRGGHRRDQPRTRSRRHALRPGNHARAGAAPGRQPVGAGARRRRYRRALPAAAATGRHRMNAPLNILLVDDHSLCRSGLSDLLTQRGLMQVFATGEPEQVAGLLREHEPDLVVLDLRMPAIDGLALLRSLRAAGLQTPALILTMSDAQEDFAA